MAPLPLSLAERDRRWAAVWAVLERARLDALVAAQWDDASDEPNLRYLCGGAPDPPWLTICTLEPGAPPSLAGEFLQAPVGPASWGVRAHVSRRPLDDVCDLILCRGGHPRVGIVGLRDERGGRGLPHAALSQLRQRIPSATWIDATQPLREVRQIKSPEEIELLRVSAARLDAAFSRLAECTHSGQTEDAAWAAAIRGMVQGSRTLPSVLSWASGSRPSPLPLVAQGTLQRGNVLVSDLVATTDGYRARAAQAVAVEACDPVIADLHTLQAEYWQSAFGLLRSGAPLGRIAEEAIEQGRRLAPNEGHLRSAEFEFRLVGCGLGGDLPRHSSLVTESGVSPPLRPGCVFCFDPAVTLQIGRWRYTARWSDTVVITPRGPQRLGLRQVGLTLAAS